MKTYVDKCRHWWTLQTIEAEVSFYFQVIK